MDNEQMNQTYGAEQQAQITLGEYVAKTYLWMFAGLLVTFGVAIAGYATNAMVYVYSIPYGLMIISGLELFVVFFLSARINKLSVNAARGLFLFYAVLNGIVFSVYFAAFGVATLVLVFGATALFFGAMATVSYVCKVDVSGIKPLLMGGLIILIVFGLLSMFLNLQFMDTAMCYLGIVVFLGFTAYDTGKLRQYYAYYAGQPEVLEKASVFSALSLYLDFINLFLYLLRLLGRSRN